MHLQSLCLFVSNEIARLYFISIELFFKLLQNNILDNVKITGDGWFSSKDPVGRDWNKKL